MLEIPVTYQGGKQRLSKQIVDIVFENNNINENTHFYDICCGSGAITIELLNRGIKPSNIAMCDASPWGEFYKSIGNNSFDLSILNMYINDIPKDLSKVKEYAKDLLTTSTKEDMVYKFLILQACAFGGTATWIENDKWCKAGGLRDYWLPTPTSNRRSPVNPMMPMPDTLYRRVENLVNNCKGLHGYCMDVFDFLYILDEECDINNNANMIIYIDPPYINTQQYGYSFDIYELERRIFNNVPIYISEGFKMDSSKQSYLLSNSRNKGNINGKIKKKSTEEWLNLY